VDVATCESITRALHSAVQVKNSRSNLRIKVGVLNARNHGPVLQFQLACRIDAPTGKDIVFALERCDLQIIAADCHVE